MGWFPAGIAGVLLLLGAATASAATANLSKSFSANGSFPNGSLVSLDPKNPDHVELANTANGSRLIGVILASDDSLLAVDPAAGKVQVATNGSVDALVSSLGGAVKVGDEIGVSPFSGIGMKAAAGSRVIGLAQNRFSEDSPAATKQTVTDKEGRQHQLSVGYVRVSISVTTQGGPKGSSLSSLQTFVQGLTGHKVAQNRVVLSLAITVIAFLVLVTLIYSAIYGSIVSVGRNPLAKYAIFRALGSVSAIAVLTALFAAVSVFFLLR
jgi:hypothetical protein